MSYWYAQLVAPFMSKYEGIHGRYIELVRLELETSAFFHEMGDLTNFAQLIIH